MPGTATALASLATVAARRARRGPRHPGWSWRFEIANEFLLRTMIRLARRPWPEQRHGWAALARPSPLLPRFRRDRVDADGVLGEWFAPLEGPADAPVLLYLHGGGFVYGSIRTHEDLVLRLALASGARALALEYRLAPEHPFPAALEDAVRAYRWALRSGVAADRLVVAGDSSGGNLAVALLLSLRAAHEALPAGAALLCPWVDLEARGGSVESNAAFDWAEPWMFDTWVEAYLGGASPKDPLASPSRTASLSGLPPLLIQVGGAEMNRDQGCELAERARADGVDVTLEIHAGMTHLWHSLAAMMPELGPARDAIESVGRFVQRCTARAEPATSSRRVT
jgi:epsilon-lactone hydrolase